MNQPTDQVRCNVSYRVTEMAHATPDNVAVAEPTAMGRDGRWTYRSQTFAEFEHDIKRLARGFVAAGVRPGMRVALLVPMSAQLIALVFALLRAGAVLVLIDPGIGRSAMLECLREAKPEGWVAISLAMAVRTLLFRRFPTPKVLVTVGRRWFWGGKTLDQVRRLGEDESTPLAPTKSDDAAAIIFTTGSTGPPKGVLYRHGNFDRQVAEIRDFYGIRPGEVDVPGFPLFALFNAAMGVTTVVPKMDFTRPAQANPQYIADAVRDWKATQAFGSPALWNVVGRWCEAQGETLPTLKRVLSAGAPVPAHVLRRMKAAIALDGDIHTPYGATEALPIASMPASVLLVETTPRSARGEGTCVGQPFPGIAWRTIEIDDGPIPTIDRARACSPGAIGELIVQGPVVTREYVTRVDANALHKIADGERFWHRMGDVGWIDEQGRFWFCGRKSHRVTTAAGPMFTIPCEAIFNQHPTVYRSAMVGIGASGAQRPVIVVEPWPEKFPRSIAERKRLIDELAELGQASPLTRSIDTFFVMQALPVDIRHNAKIFRERLAVWAAKQLANG